MYCGDDGEVEFVIPAYDNICDFAVHAASGYRGTADDWVEADYEKWETHEELGMTHRERVGMLGGTWQRISIGARTWLRVEDGEGPGGSMLYVTEGPASG